LLTLHDPRCTSPKGDWQALLPTDNRYGAEGNPGMVDAISLEQGNAGNLAGDEFRPPSQHRLPPDPTHALTSY
jgi:hypothetical protein